MQVATSRASSRRSAGNSGNRSLTSTSRASASRAGASGRSRISQLTPTLVIGITPRPAGVEQHQNLQFALAGPPPGQGQIEAALAARNVALALLQRNHRPAHARQNLPEADPHWVDHCAALALVAAVKRRALGDAAGFTVEPGKAPAFRAEPTDILVRVAPAGEFPIEDSGQGRAVEEIIAGAEIMVAQDRRKRLRQMRFEPAHAPFQHRPWRWVTVEIGAEPGDLRRRPGLLRRRQKAQIG